MFSRLVVRACALAVGVMLRGVNSPLSEVDVLEGVDLRGSEASSLWGEFLASHLWREGLF